MAPGLRSGQAAPRGSRRHPGRTLRYAVRPGTPPHPDLSRAGPEVPESREPFPRRLREAAGVPRQDAARRAGSAGARVVGRQHRRPRRASRPQGYLSRGRRARSWSRPRCWSAAAARPAASSSPPPRTRRRRSPAPSWAWTIKGITVRRVLVAPAADIVRELYLAAVLDRAARRVLMMGSAEGGVEIEELAETDPDAIQYDPCPPAPWPARLPGAAAGLRARPGRAPARRPLPSPRASSGR